MFDRLQTDRNPLGEWVVENELKIYPGKGKSVSFTKARVKERIRYYFGNKLMAETSTFKYLGIIIRSFCKVIRSNPNWADHINYTLRKAWKRLLFIMLILKMGNNNIKRLANAALVRPILQYGAMCWDHTGKAR